MQKEIFLCNSFFFLRETMTAPSEVDTLRALAEHSRALTGRRFLIPMNRLFFEYLHNRPMPKRPSNSSIHEFRQLPSLWADAVQPQGGGYPTNPADRAKQPMQLVRGTVINGAETASKDLFMGPLCCPLSKATLPLLQRSLRTATRNDEEEGDDREGDTIGSSSAEGATAPPSSLSPTGPYWVTEKSDGIRCILTSLLCGRFPRWVIAGCSPLVVSLVDVMLLEQAWLALHEDPNLLETDQIRLTFGSHVMRRTEGQGPDVFLLVLRTREGPSTTGGAEKSVRVQRSVGPRHFTYLFDRSMDTSYLLVDEYPFAPHAVVVLDGELMLATPPAAAAGDRAATAECGTSASSLMNPFFGVFDCFAVGQIPLDSTTGAPNLSRTMAELSDVSHMTLLQREPMSARYQFLEERVLQPMLRQRLQVEHTLAMIRKPMFRLEEIPKILADLKVERMRSSTAAAADAAAQAASSPTNADAEDGSTSVDRFEYRYHGYGGKRLGITLNDGLIFTPENFDIVSGSQPNQLKWKWPDKLTVDWRIQPARAPGCYEVYAYFKKKRVGAPDDAGHAQFSRSMRLLNPNHLSLPPRGSADWPLVVECSFDHKSWYWSIERIRADKKDANSIVTIVSVMESIAERLDLVTMLSAVGVPLAAVQAVEGFPLLLQPNSNSSRSNAPSLSSVDVAAVKATNSEDPSDLGNSDAATAAGAALTPQQQRRAQEFLYSKPPPPCKLVVRATLELYRNHISLSVQWVVKLPDVRNVIPCNHRLVADCFGLGEHSAAAELEQGRTPPTSKLAGLLQIGIANAGGCYAWSNVLCDAIFDPATGRWGIVRLHPARSSNEAFHTQVLDHLFHVAAYRSLQPNGECPPLPDGILPSPSREEVVTAPPSAGGSLSMSIASNEHYAERTRLLSHGVQHRSNLRRVHNLIKSLLLQRVANHVRRTDSSSSGSKNNGSLICLDLCCGRGGDLHKWKAVQATRLVMVDSCFEAVAEAAARYNVTCGLSTKITPGKEGYPGIPAFFGVWNCFASLQQFFEEASKNAVESFTPTVPQSSSSHHAAKQNHHPNGGRGQQAPPHSSSPSPPPTSAPTVAAVPPPIITTPTPTTPIPLQFDMVSCQFSMHYGFSSEQNVRQFLQNISSALRVGGRFVGTTVDDEAIQRKRSAAAAVTTTAGTTASPIDPSMYHGETFGNALYSVTFQKPLGSAVVDNGPQTIYGEAYRFSLEASVADEEEYLVHWQPFVDLCSTYGLTLKETRNFSVLLEEESAALGNLLSKLASENSHSRGEEGGEGGKGGFRRTRDGVLMIELEEEEREVVGLYRSFIFEKIS